MKDIKVLFAEQNGKCYYCKCDTVLPGPMLHRNKPSKNMATREHLIPKSEGGTNSPINLKMSCYECNSNRGAMNSTKWYSIVNDKKKIAAFFLIKELYKQLKSRKQKVRQERFLKQMQDRMLKKYGMCYTYITMDTYLKCKEQYQRAA